MQGSQCFVGEILPEQPVERMHKKRPCKQRRLQPLQCGTLLEVREGACRARQREWYRRELDDHKVFVSWNEQGTRAFYFSKAPPGQWINVELEQE